MAKNLGSNFWQGHLESWERSGLTQIAYCAQRGLSVKTFRRWRSKGKGRVATKPLPVTLVPVSVNTSPMGGGVQLHSPGGWRIDVSEVSLAGLADLLRQLP